MTKYFTKFLHPASICFALLLGLILATPRSLISQYASPVNVLNSKAAPANVLDVKGLTPYQVTAISTCSAGFGACSFATSKTPAAGTRIVIQNMNGYFQLGANNATSAIFGTGNGGADWTLPTITPVDVGGGNVRGGFNTNLRIVLVPGDSMQVVAIGSFSHLPSTVVFSGYVENCAVTGCPAIVE